MSSEKIFYVYEHVRPDTGQVFYVGKGCAARVNRPDRKNRHHKNIVEKLRSIGLKIEIRIVFKTERESEALKAEIERISYWKALGIKLCNLTKGGDGISGWVPTEENLANMSRGHKLQFEDQEKRNNHLAAVRDPQNIAKLNAARKRQYSDPKSRKTHLEAVRRPEHREKQRRAANLRWADPEARKKASDRAKQIFSTPEARAISSEMLKRYYADPAARRKSSEAANSRKKPVFCPDNNVIYESISAAAKALGLRSGPISEICNGKRNHTGGYHFQYADKA